MATSLRLAGQIAVIENQVVKCDNAAIGGLVTQVIRMRPPRYEADPDYRAAVYVAERLSGEVLNAPKPA